MQATQVDLGALIAQLGELQTLDRKVADSIITMGAVLCPLPGAQCCDLEQDASSPLLIVLVKPGSRPKMTEKLLTRM